MSTFWIVALVGGSVAIVGGLALLMVKLQSGPPIATVTVTPGQPFSLAVPAASKQRELWIRYRLTLTVPMARGQPVTPGSFYGITLRLDLSGDLGGTRVVVARGGLAPAGVDHFGVVDYMYRYDGPTLATTVKVRDVPGSEPMTITGTIEVADANQLLDASVWVTA